ncbi:MAG: hypothetical protein K6G70_10995 [Bacteroidaceae bacterium]|nr:hypothetical protein [Bacteroidaceae bacterium]
MSEKVTNEFDRQYGESYRQGVGSCNPTKAENYFDKESSSAQSVISDDAKALAEQVKPRDLEKVEVFGHDVLDYINEMLPKGAPEGSRHKFALKVAGDLFILCDGNADLARYVLLKLPWVVEIINERGEDEIARIIDAAQKRLHKRESENFNDPQPSKEMRKAIEQVANRKYSLLLREAHNKSLGLAMAAQDDIRQTLERIGRGIEKLIQYYPLLKLLCFRIKRKYFPAAMFVGGAFAMTLMTRCWYLFWPKPGKHCRLNSLLMLIGRLGGLKSMAVDLEAIMIDPIHVADAPQVAALNASNAEREQNNGGAKSKKPRPTGIYRALPAETSTAALREAEANAHQMLDGEEFYLHVSTFDSELQNTLNQLKKGYMDALQTYWLKSFHSEKHGAYLKTSNAPVGETPVHFNAVYTGTDDALKKLNTESNNVNGLMSRFTIVPNADSEFEMMEVYDYDDAARQRDDELKAWSYKLDACKGEIPCKPISDALHQWTARRMADAGEDKDYAEEDLVKRPCWHAINYVLPFVVTRHWDKMVQDGAYWVCGPEFQVDKYDIQLALLIANAQLAFQEYYCKGLLEKHYEDLATENALNKRPQKKTLLAYRRLPDPFTSEDVKREYGYDNVGSVCSRLKILQDDGMAQKIRSGADKGKYRKTMS